MHDVRDSIYNWFLPVVSMLLAMMGTPLYVLPLFLNFISRSNVTSALKRELGNGHDDKEGSMIPRELSIIAIYLF